MTDQSPDAKPKVQYTSGDMLAGFIFGLITAVPIGALIYFNRIDQIKEGARLAAFAAVGGGLVAIFGLISLRIVLKKVFGREAPTAQTVVDDAAASVRAFEEGNTAEARSAAGRAISGGLGIYAWLTARQWITSVFLGAVALFAGSASTWILFQQNTLIQRQSDILEEQKALLNTQSLVMRDAMLTQDALRYVPLYGDLTRLMEDIQREGAARDGLEDYQLVRLSPDLSARIVTLSRTFRPYWYFDSFARFDRQPSPSDDGTTLPPPAAPMVFLSPERGMILKALVENKAILPEPWQADFTYADMRGVTVEGINVGAPIVVNEVFETGSCQLAASTLFMDFQKTVSAIEIDRAYYEGRAIIPKWPLSAYRLDNADFSEATLRDVALRDLDGTIRFHGAQLRNVRFVANSSLNLSGAVVGAISLEAELGGIRPDIVGHDAVFYMPICVPEIEEVFNPNVSQPTDAEAALAIDSLVTLRDENFTGAIFRLGLRARDLFPGLNIDTVAGRIRNHPDPRFDVCFEAMQPQFYGPPNPEIWQPNHPNAPPC